MTDQFLRRDLLPALVGLPGLAALYTARGSAEAGDERIVVSVWSRVPDDGGDLGEALDFELGDVVSEPVVVLLEPAFALEFDRPEPVQILRVFRGTVVPGRLDDYVEEAHSGVLADVAAEHGPHAIYLCRQPPESFVTVSVWSGWDRIQLATGGNLRQPISTQHSHLLASGTADHYEIVPNTIAGRPGEPVAADGADDDRPQLAGLAASEQP